ncbi:MAG TPA: CsgG/HfaB family protein [Leptospiraceae bacterium]|nr:CsgG/HfaB family protein [Leptospiraceae bacterium]HNF17087.1 CsgG/HfaB family protein [Leptospiraceae bacterium]HNF27106.1 CsgG/HfaB family protein [Leptospiraceae bacterium]HNI99823.1 CsgG/HfaB family protein [Leptospiraceae bacterium]HNO25651.1 CsgG/HfaB family protein [Leptospiraceae bacterium]
MIKIVLLPSLLILMSCQMSSDVRIRTVPASGYDAYYNSEYIGRTPVSLRASNYFGSDHEIEFRSKNLFLKREKLRLEWKPFNVFFSWIFYFLPLIWAYGPSEEQVFYVENISSLKTAEGMSQTSNVPKQINAAACEKTGPVISVKPVFKKTRSSGPPILNFAMEEAIIHTINKLLKNYRGPQKQTILVSVKKINGTNENSETGKIGRFMYSKAADAIFSSRTFTLIEREHINSLLREKSLTLQGITDSEKSQLAGADMILLMNFNYNVLEGKIVELKTGEILSYASEVLSE